MSTTTTTPALGALVRQELRGYAASWLFRVGALVTAAITVAGFRDDDGTSSTLTMIVPAALIGVLGLVVMAGLARRSDRAAAVAGAVAVPERTRTLALAAATVLPVAVALAWYAAAVIQFRLQPPASFAVPFGPMSDGHVLAVMFALGVMPALGGPLLGLVLARWLQRRGTVPVAVVLVVLVTIVMQGNFESTWRWHVIWPWTYWYGPLGWETTGSGETLWVALRGSPYAWIAYLAALCLLGLLVAVYHDPESDRPRLRRAIAGVALVAVVALVLTLTLGLDDAVRNSIPGPSF